MMRAAINIIVALGLALGALLAWTGLHLIIFESHRFVAGLLGLAFAMVIWSAVIAGGQFFMRRTIVKEVTHERA